MMFALFICVTQVLEMLVERQNSYLSNGDASSVSGIVAVPLNCVTDSVLLGDATGNSFERLLQLYSLTPQETQLNSNVPFVLHRIKSFVSALLLCLAEWPSCYLWTM